MGRPKPREGKENTRVDAENVMLALYERREGIGEGVDAPSRDRLERASGKGKGGDCPGKNSNERERMVRLVTL